jgi:hypothetical protein
MGMTVDDKSTSNDLVNGDSNYSSSSLEDVSTDSQLKSDLQSNDKATQKAAMEHLVKLILDAIKAGQGEGEDQPTEGNDSKGSPKTEGSGEAPSGMEDLIKALVEKVAEDAGLSDMQTEQLGESANATAEEQGLTETTETT